MSESTLYYASPSVPSLRRLMQLSTTYDKIFCSHQVLHDVFRSSTPFADFLDTGDTKKAQQWATADLMSLFLEQIDIHVGDDALSEKDRILSGVDFTSVPLTAFVLPEELYGEASSFISSFEKIRKFIWNNHPEKLPIIAQTFRELDLFTKEVITFEVDDPIKTEEQALQMERVINDALRLDMHDNQLSDLIEKNKVIFGHDADNRSFQTSVFLNSALYEAATMNMPWHLDDKFLPIIEYKLLRGANFGNDQKRSRVLDDSISVLIPSFYNQTVSGFLEIRGTKEFKSFRKSFNKLAHSLPSTAEVNDFSNEYVSQLERRVAESSPNFGIWLLKTLVSTANPILGLVISGTDGFQQLLDTYATHSLAISTVKLKRRIKKSQKSTS